ncbi:MAG: class I SAM-dependent methyltransferase [Candidatus Electrothrix sp. ATG2]|nr:class I SAM-dependent methyltransferase [Candidatus Electrothrix sp. ATG2]
MEKIKVPIKKYWNKRSNSYGLDKDKCVATAETWGTVLNTLVTDGFGKRALDVGTGTGQFAVYLAQDGFEVTAIDLSDDMIAAAQQNAEQENLPIDFKVGDAEHLEFADNSFDVIVSRNLLWTLPQPEKALREWKRVLKPGGRLVVSDGFWMNTTWKGMHHLVLNMLKDGFRKSSRQSLHFFWNYSGIHRSLPFYSGLNVNDASLLLEKVFFNEIKWYDTSCFTSHPYKRGKFKKKTPPPFFIAYADK